MNADNNDDIATNEEMKLAAAYLGSGMLVTDAIRRIQARINSGLDRHVCSLPCSGWCQDTSNTTWIMRFVGNDIDLTRKLQVENLNKGLSCTCNECANKHFKIADALDFHRNMLLCVKRRDDRGAAAAASKRGEILKQLGYKVA